MDYVILLNRIEIPLHQQEENECPLEKYNFKTGSHNYLILLSLVVATVQLFCYNCHGQQ